MRNILTSCLMLVAGSAANAQISGVTDATGGVLVDRLFENSGVAAGAVTPGSVSFVGQTLGGSQSGLLESLTLRGAGGTTLSLGRGIVLSSGLVTGLPTTNTISWYSNITGTGGNNFFRDFPAQTGTTRHGGRLQERDQNVLEFDIDVPAGIAGFRAEFVYASEEFPEWSGTGYADGFACFVDGVNYAVLPDGRPVSLLSQADNVHFMTNGDSFDPSVPSVFDYEYDGATRVLELTASLRAGHRQHVVFVVADTGDEIYDSAAFLSSLRFVPGDAPLPGSECHVHVRHNSPDDDAFVEFGNSVACDSIDFNGDGLSPDTQDIDDFLSVFSGGTCPTGTCGDIDFNNDGLFPDTSDLDALLSVFSGGACS